ncbi:hypothetical protein HK096_011447, partial [Nowakowskiella sp. JEL0078]
AIGKLIFLKCRLNDALLLSTLLSTSLVNLKRKGFPVDRILNLTASRLKEAAILQEQKRQQAERMMEEEKKRLREQSEKTVTDQLSTSVAPPVPRKEKNSLDSTLTQSVMKDVEDLTKIFPDVDLGYARQEVEKLGSKMASDQKLQTLTNRWLESSYQKKSLEPKENDTLNADKSKSSEAEEENLYNMFNRVGKSLGLWDSNSTNKVSGTSENGSPPLPPRHDQEESKISKTVTKQTSSTVAPGPPANPLEQINPEFTKSLKNQLSRSLQSLQSNRDPGFRADIPGDNSAPEIPRNSLSANHCTIISDNDLVLHPDTFDNLTLFYDRRVSGEIQTIVTSVHGRDGLKRFAGVLRLLASVFSVPAKTMHLYFDQRGETVAFNRNKTIFFNARYYLGLHYSEEKNSDPSDRNSLVPRLALPGSFGGSFALVHSSNAVSEKNSETYYYWFMVACHELAHNWVSEHNSQHEFYLSSFAQYYMKNLVKTLQENSISL